MTEPSRHHYSLIYVVGRMSDDDKRAVASMRDQYDVIVHVSASKSRAHRSDHTLFDRFAAHVAAMSEEKFATLMADMSPFLESYR